MVNRPFLDIFTDSIRFASLCNISGATPGIHNCMAKASILHSIFALECAENCCVAVMEYSSNILDAVDRWQPLEKFEFVQLLFNPSRPFDRGTQEVQHLKELFKIRNDYVHPKARELSTRMTQEHGLELGTSKSQFLGIPRETNFWSQDHASIVIKSACKFDNSFFLEWCNLPQGEVTSMLLSGIIKEQHIQPLLIEDHRIVLRAARSALNLDLRFLDLDSSPTGWLKTSDQGEELVSSYKVPAHEGGDAT
jgi:hypothetical protein